MSIPRTRGALTGLLLIGLGLWGGLIPFIGPSFGYAIGPDNAWDWTAGRLWLEVLPAVVVVAGGVLLLTATTRGAGAMGGALALAGGAWFIVGPSMSMLWNDGVAQTGAAHGSTGVRVLAWLGFFYLLGAAIAVTAAWALGRFSVVSVRDLEVAAPAREPVTAATAAEPGSATTGTAPAASPPPRVRRWPSIHWPVRH
jgi:hypothetical protein